MRTRISRFECRGQQMNTDSSHDLLRLGREDRSNATTLLAHSSARCSRHAAGRVWVIEPVRLGRASDRRERGSEQRQFQKDEMATAIDTQ